MWRLPGERERRASDWLGMDVGVWLILLVSLSVVAVIVELVFGRA